MEEQGDDSDADPDDSDADPDWEAGNDGGNASIELADGENY